MTVYQVDCLACRLSLIVFLDVLLIASDIQTQILQKTMTLLVVVGLVVHPMSIECQAKVRNLEMTGSSNEEVVRLDVTVYPVHLVCLFDAENHLCDILLRNVLIEYILPQKKAQEVTAHHVVHNEVQIVVVLEGRDQGNDPTRAL